MLMACARKWLLVVLAQQSCGWVHGAPQMWLQQHWEERGQGKLCPSFFGGITVLVS